MQQEERKFYLEARDIDDLTVSDDDLTFYSTQTSTDVAVSDDNGKVDWDSLHESAKKIIEQEIRDMLMYSNFQRCSDEVTLIYNSKSGIWEKKPEPDEGEEDEGEENE